MLLTSTAGRATLQHSMSVGSSAGEKSTFPVRAAVSRESLEEANLTNNSNVKMAIHDRQLGLHCFAPCRHAGFEGRN